MKFRKTLSCCLFLFLGVVPAIAWEGTVTQVVDGDSLKVRRQGGGSVHIRLYGIDAPEFRQKDWEKAKGTLSDLVQGKKVTIKEMDRDRYGRTVALVRSRGKLVNEELVRRALVWVYPWYCKAEPLCENLKEMERVNKESRQGLWREGRPVPPWVMKRGKGKR